jgi:hypothetical protein
LEKLKQTSALVPECGSIHHATCVSCVIRLSSLYAESGNDASVYCASSDNPESFCTVPGDGVSSTRSAFHMSDLRLVLTPECIQLVENTMSQRAAIAIAEATSDAIGYDAVNHYVSRGVVCAIPFVLHETVSIDMLVACIEHILYNACSTEATVTTLHCFRCRALLESSVDCNVVVHCGLDHCTLCGCCDEKIPSDHWGWTDQFNTCCPRYVQTPDWLRHVQASEYICTDTLCRTHETECVVAEHMPGRQRLAVVRCIYRLHRALYSTSPVLRERVLVHYEPDARFLWLHNESARMFGHPLIEAFFDTRPIKGVPQSYFTREMD